MMGWILLAEFGGFAGFAVGAWIADAIQRARWNRLAVHVFTRDPVANLTTPTMIATHGPEWVLPVTRQDDVVASRPRES